MLPFYDFQSAWQLEIYTCSVGSLEPPLGHRQKILAAKPAQGGGPPSDSLVSYPRVTTGMSPEIIQFSHVIIHTCLDLLASLHTYMPM